MDERPPTSLGALPVGLGGRGDLVVPVADEEAFWIGLDFAPHMPVVHLGLTVNLHSGGAAENAVVAVPPARCVAGFSREGPALYALSRLGAPDAGGGCDSLMLSLVSPANEVPAFAVIVRLLGPRAFADETGLAPPPPLDPGAGYGGWLLP